MRYRRTYILNNQEDTGSKKNFENIFFNTNKKCMYGEQKNSIQLFFSKEYIKKLIRIDFKGQLKSSANFFLAKNSNLSLFNIKNV